MAELASNGIERAAILLMTLGEEPAAAVLRHLKAEQVQQLGSAMASLSDVSRDRVSRVLGELIVAVHDKTSIGVGAEDYLRKVMTSSLGERKARGFLDRIFKSRPSTGLEGLKWMDARTVAQLIREEHPQIIATILVHLSAGQAAEVLAQFAADQQADIALRIARLEEVPEAALKELDAIVDEQTKETAQLRASRLGGIRAVADIINLLESGSEGAIMDVIRAQDAELGERIQESLFVFENLLAIDDRGIQTLMREVQTDTLGLALKGADLAIQDKIFRNMSKRAAEILKDDMAVKGPVRLADVEAAQREILAVVQRLAEEGQLMISGRGEAFV